MPYACHTYTYVTHLSAYNVVDCDHMVQENMEIGIDSIDQCLIYLCAEASADRSILRYWIPTEEDQWDVETVLHLRRQ